MDRESNFSVDTQVFLAVSARYLGLETQIAVAPGDWAIAPTADCSESDRSPYRFEAVGQRCA